MIIEEIKAKTSFEKFLFNKENIEERVYNYTHFFANGHMSRADIFERSTGLKPVHQEESNWFMYCGEIPEHIKNRKDISGTENMEFYESREEMINCILERKGLKRIGNTNQFIYTGKNKGAIIGRGGCVIRQLSALLGIKINVV